MADVTPETENFGFTRVGKGESISKQGFAALDLDRVTLDDLLQAIINHEHDASPRLEGPMLAPLLTAQLAGGTLKPGVTYYYKISYVDRNGLETSASPETSVTTPDPIATPTAPSLTLEASGGTLAATGRYSYAITFVDANGGETLASDASSVNLSSGATNRIRLDIPDLPAGAVSVRVYRSRPGQQRLYFLTETTDDPYYDTGALAEDATVTTPTANDTNTTNSIRVDLPEALSGEVFGWKIYRALDPGRYADASLVKNVVETDEPGSDVLFTAWTDDNSPLAQGVPRHRSATIGGGRIVQLNQISGDIPLASVPRGARVLNAFVPGTVTDAAEIYRTIVPDAIIPLKVTAHFQDLPSGLTGGATPTLVRIVLSDNSPTPKSVELVCDDDGGFYAVEFPSTYEGELEAELGTPSSEAVVPIEADPAASNQQAVQLNLSGEYIEHVIELDPGSYEVYVRARADDASATPTDDLTLSVLNDSTEAVIASASYTLDVDYVEFGPLAFDVPDGVVVRFRAAKATAIEAAILVDQFRYAAVLDELIEGEISIQTFIDGAPADPGGSINVSVWF